MSHQYLTFNDLQAHFNHLDEIGVTYDAVVTGGGGGGGSFSFHLRDDSGEPDRQIEVTIFNGGTWSARGLPVVEPKPCVAEGWGMFVVDGRLQLQRDETSVFSSDGAAIMFVAEKARLGSQYHIDAIYKIGSLAK